MYLQPPRKGGCFNIRPFCRIRVSQDSRIRVPPDNRFLIRFLSRLSGFPSYGLKRLLVILRFAFHLLD